jgi:hypothetical protein
MAQEKPLDLSIVQAWLSAWNERDIFSDAAVRHLQSLINRACKSAISRKRSLVLMGIRSGSTANLSIPTMARLGGTRSRILVRRCDRGARMWAW